MALIGGDPDSDSRRQTCDDRLRKAGARAGFGEIGNFQKFSKYRIAHNGRGWGRLWYIPDYTRRGAFSRRRKRNVG